MDAKVELGKSYWHGVGVEKDSEQAASLLLDAAKQGHAGARTLVDQMVDGSNVNVKA